MVYTVKREVSKEQFTRELFIKLAKDEQSPPDIFTAKFGEVKEATKEMLICEGHVETDFTASVGYDQKVKTWNPDTQKYVEKTVTDWQPFSGHLNGDKSAIAANSGTYQDVNATAKEHDRFCAVLHDIKDEDIEKIGTADVSPAGLENAKKLCAVMLESEIKYPGDQAKNIKVSSSVSVNELKCYKVPYYNVSFTYRGQEFSASGYACGTPNAESQVPLNRNDHRFIAKEKTKGLKIATIILWVAVLVAFIAAIVAGGSVWIVPGVLAVCAMAETIFYMIKHDKIFNEVKNANKAQRLEGLKAALTLKGLPSLSSEEEKNI